jgi:thioredoxin 1
MPIFDTPITTDDHNLTKVLAQNLPVVLYLYDNRNSRNNAIDEVLGSLARQYAGQLLVARVDAAANPNTWREYGNLATPAIVTLEKDGGSRVMKSRAGAVYPADIQAHVDYLLGKGPAPKQPAASQTHAAHGSASAGKAAPQAVTDASFEAEVLRSKLPVLVDFWAPWCGPCRMIAPAVEQVAQTYAGRARVVKVNIDENPMLARQFQVMSIPTLMVFKNGQPVKRQVGANPGIIASMVEEALR